MHRLNPTLSAVLLALLSTGAFCHGQDASAPTAEVAEGQTDYARLKEPAVAAALGLSEEQKTRVDEITSSGEERLAAAAEDTEKAAIRSEIATNLESVLDPRQRSLYESLFSGTRLRFNFRLQKWPDVLDYIADEAGLSLVMNEPPEGVFNYSDSREYTPTEAIDLVNGWLQTKGYTLIRRERLLMCLSIKDGLPENTIPRIDPAELPTRGRFDLVSILLPLEGRPVDKVVTEAEALKGTYGEVKQLPTTGQVLLTDTAGNLRVMLPILESIPTPRPAQPKPPGPKPPPPVLEVHPIKHANPDRVGEVLKQFVSGTVLVDAKASQITINAVPSAQATAKKIIGMLEEQQGPDKQPRLQAHPIGRADPAELLDTLRMAVPNAQMRSDEQARSLVVWATPQDHSRIDTVLAQLSVRTQSPQNTQLESYRVSSVTPSAVMTLLQDLLPDARMTVSDETKSLIVIGSLEDHQAVRALLEQLDEVGTQPSAKVQTVSLGELSFDTVSTLAGAVAPEAAVSLDAASGTVLIVGTEEDQARITSAVEDLQTAAEARKATLKAYPAGDIDVSSVTSLLTALAPAATVTPSADSSQLVVIASPRDHNTVAQVLEQVTSGGREEPALKAHPIPVGVSSETVTTLLAALVPAAQVTTDPDGRRVLVVATSEDQDVVAATLEQLRASGGESLPELRFYAIDERVAGDVAAILQPLAPAATLEFDPENRRLSVVASTPDHTRIKETLAQLSKAVGDDARPALKIHGVSPEQRRRFSTIASELTEQLPGLRLISSANPAELVIWASPAQQEIVGGILDQLGQDVPLERKPALVVYAVNHLEVTSLESVLVELFPDVSITGDERGSRLLVRATASQHETIAAAIEQLDTDAPASATLKLMVYPVDGLNPETAVTVLQQEVPEATVIQDTTAQTLIVRAKLKEQELVADLLETLRTAAAPLKKKQVVVYPAGAGDPDSVASFLTSAFADTRAVVEPSTRRVSVWATAAQHAEIKSLLAAMAGGGDGDLTPVVETYSIRDLSATTLTEMLSRAVPDAKVVTNEDSSRLVAWARREDQETIRAIVTGATAGQQPDRSLQVFPVKTHDAATAREILESSIPDVSFFGAPEGSALVAWVDEEQTQQITTILDQLEQSAALAPQKSLEIFNIGAVAAPTARELLSAAFPEVSFVEHAGGTAVVARVGPAEAQQITQFLAELQDGSLLKPEQSLQIYDLLPVGGENALTILSQALPAVSFTQVGGKTAAWVSPAEHDRIQATLQQLKAQSPFRREQTLKFYSTSDVGPNAPAVLSDAVPGAVILTGTEPSRLIIRATPAEHERIDGILAELRTAEQTAPKPELATFDITGHDPAAVQSLLEPFVGDDVQMTVDTEGHRLFLRALPAKQVMLREIVESVTQGGSPRDGITTRAYRTRQGDADEIQEALQHLLPDATLVTDDDRRVLLATALPDEHEVIATIVRQMVEGVGTDDELIPRTHPLGQADGPAVLESLEALYRDRNVTLSLDSGTRAIIAVAREDDHAIIRELIEQLATIAAPDQRRTVEFYALEGADGAAVEQAVLDMLTTIDNQASVVHDSGSGQLVVTTSDDGHTRVRDAIERLQSRKAARELEVFPLRILDASSAQLAIDGIFDDGFTDFRDMPVVQVDDDSQQLLVRGTTEQIEQIRNLLIKMGETSLRQSGTASGGRIRVIPTDGDIDGAIRRIETIWPRLRRNPIRIIRPGTRTEDGPVPDGTSDETSGDECQSEPVEGTAQEQAAPNAAAAEQDSPVLLVPGPSRITISSDDLEALDQMEALLRAVFSRSMPRRNRDFSIYALQNAAATVVSEVLNNIFTRRGSPVASGAVVIVPDQRLNAIVVFGSRTDRDRIEALIEALDDDHIPETLATNQTRVVPVRSADAEQIASVIAGIYKAQMTSGGSRRQISIPEEISPQVASVLRQINAAASSPLLTVEVQEATNSLVVMAPANLLEDVTGLISELDEAAEKTRARSVSIIQLRKANSRRVMDVLDRVLD